MRNIYLNSAHEVGIVIFFSFFIFSFQSLRKKCLDSQIKVRTQLPLALILFRKFLTCEDDSAYLRKMYLNILKV